VNRTPGNQTLEAIVQSLKSRRADRRLHRFDITVHAAADGRASLSGRVLDPDDLAMLRDEIAQAGMSCDDAEIRVLRRDSPRLRTVATNLTDLHADASFLSELLTQVTNGTPLEVLEETDRWCFVRQMDGYLGWAYRSYLDEPAHADAPTHWIARPGAQAHVSPNPQAPPISYLPVGTAIEVTDVDGYEWSRVRPAGQRLPAGWVASRRLRAISDPPPPADALRARIIEDARQLTAVYYLWGGCTEWGIDCSALVQLVHKLNGITIPRDADLQFAAASAVDPPYAPGDLLFFGGKFNRRRITHVAISTGDWKIIHASRFHNGVHEDDVQAHEHLRTSFAGARRFIG
jgi:cell wall-associated NlpC family hydrolase